LSSRDSVPYSYCKSYDENGICECYSEYENPTTERNYCTKIKDDLKNCIQTFVNEYDEVLCTMCKPGYMLKIDGTCVCDGGYTNREQGECNFNRCWEDYKGCRSCTEDKCLICNTNFNNCKMQNRELKYRTEGCLYHKVVIGGGCHQCSPGYVLSHDEMSCILLATPEYPANKMSHCRQFTDPNANVCAECLPEYHANETNTECVKKGTKACVLNCREHFYNDWNDTTDPLQQKCVSNNCKKSIETDRTQCKECWNSKDMSNYLTWIGRHSYSYQDMFGISEYNPWTLVTRENPDQPGVSQSFCRINCKDGYFRDWDEKTQGIFEQKCTRCSFNCKTCRYFKENCTTCWNIQEVYLYPEITDTYTDLEGVDLNNAFMIMKDYGLLEHGKVYDNEKLGFKTKAIFKNDQIHLMYPSVESADIHNDDPDGSWKSVFYVREPYVMTLLPENLPNAEPTDPQQDSIMITYDQFLNPIKKAKVEYTELGRFQSDVEMLGEFKPDTRVLEPFRKVCKINCDSNKGYMAELIKAPLTQACFTCSVPTWPKQYYDII